MKMVRLPNIQNQEISMNNKGFTLTEVLVVVIIIAILVAISVPFLLGYAREARNDRAKSALILIAQGYKNFKTDFPGVIIPPGSRQVSRQNLVANSTDCTIPSSDTAAASDLIKCGYIVNRDYANMKYSFYIGNSCNCVGSSATDLACMIGNDGDAGDPFGSSYCAFVDRNNTLIEASVAH